MKYRFFIAITTIVFILSGCLFFIKLNKHSDKENKLFTRSVPIKSDEQPMDLGIKASEAQNKIEDIDEMTVADSYSDSYGITWIVFENTFQAHFYSIPKSVLAGNTKSSNGMGIKTKTEALKHIHKNLSMPIGGWPRVAFEDADYYYFSGVVKAYRVDDFSSGVGVSKATGEIIDWGNEK